MRLSRDHRRAAGRVRPVRVAAVVALAVATTGVLAGPAAAAPVVGGATFGEPVLLPVPALNGTFEGSNVGISSSGTRPAVTPAYWTNVAWYSFTPEASGTLTVTTAAQTAGYDTTLEVWTAAGGFIAENDDYQFPTTVNSRLAVDVRAGTPYRLGLGSYGNGSNGVATMTLAFAPQAPGTPVGVLAVAGHRQAQVTWTEPDVFATSFTVWCTPAGGAEVECGQTAAAGGQPPATATTVTGLTNGVTYGIRVTAHNSVGASAPSATASATPQATSTVELGIDPAAPVSGESVDVAVTVTSAEGPATGTVHVTVGGTSHPGVALVDGVATVTVSLPVGSYTVGAAYSGSAAVTPGTAATTLDVVKRPQTVTLDPLPDGLVYGDGPVTLVASSSVGLPVTLTPSGACTVDGDQLTLTAAGECTVTAEAGDDQTETASASRTVTVGVRSQNLDVTALSPMVYGQDPVPFDATSSVGLPVSVVASGACELSGGAIVTTTVGACTVTATQAGDASTFPAEVVQTVDVVKRSQTVSITGVPVLITDNAPLTVSASSDLGLPVTLTASGACALDGDALVVVDVGECRVTADSAGDTVTEPAEATVAAMVMGESPTVSVRLGIGVGDIVEGTMVDAGGTWLRPGTELTLTVFSTPARLGTGLVSADGTAETPGMLPALPTGTHRLVAEGVALDGSTVTATVAFGVDEFGQVAWVGQPPGLATTGAELGGAGTLAALWVLVGAGLVGVARTRGRLRTARA